MKLPTKTHALLCLAVACGLPMLAAAETGASEDWHPLDRLIVVAYKVATPTEQVVGTVSVIEREDLDRRQSQDIRDLVRYEPGVTVLDEPDRFGPQGFVIRGLDGNRVAMEVDGVPLPEGFGVGNFSRAGRDVLDIELLERVEILRGPASTLYGSDALAGVVAYRSRDPRDLLSPGGDDQSIGLRLGHATRDASTRLAGLHAGSRGDWSMLALASRREGHELDNSARDRAFAANPADYRRDALLAKLLYAGGSRAGDWRLTLEHNRAAADTDVQSLVNGPGQFATTEALDARDDYRRRRISLDAHFQPGLAWLDEFELLLYDQATDYRQRADQLRRPDPRTPHPTRRLRGFDFAQDQRGVKALGQARHDTGALSHWHIFGIEYARSAFDATRDGLEINLASGAQTSVIIGERFPLRDFPISVSRELGAFWQDEIALGDSAFALIPGLRWERYRLDAYPDALFVERNPGIDTADVSSTSTTPRLGLRWQLGEGLHLFAQHARGYRAPPFGDVNVGFAIPMFNYIALPNPDLRAEKSRGHELGLHWERPGTTAQVSLYRNDYRDLIESRANLGIDPDSGALIFQSVNRDRARIEGIELALEQSLDAWTPRAEGFRLRFAAAWSRGDDRQRDQPLNTVEPARAVLGLAYDSSNGRFGGEASIIGVAGKTRVDDSRGELFRPPGYGLIDLSTWYSPHPNVRLHLAAHNLADRRHWNWASLRGLPADTPNLEFFTGAGRSVSFGVSLDW
ncbi:MAG TPA: TonB-dependent hemoglobin/transferrin/lactoferrin family receptor [Xanthomonadaceae bacterium]|nr:TonB-dependent hemoglobin/transferrin/lactoferrin family receptor [Xanthomonadaceae bacterium]